MYLCYKHSIAFSDKHTLHYIGKVMEYSGRAVETLIFDILICWEFLSLKLLTSDLLRDASNELLNAHRMFIDSQYNDGCPGRFWKF